MTLSARGRAAVLTLIVLLAGPAGCSGLFKEEAPPPPPAVEAPPPPAVILPQEKPAVRSGPDEVTLAGATPFPGKDLIGMSQEEARVVLGPPAVISQSAPAEVWRYAFSQDCLLTLFFYLDMAGSDWRVLTFEVEPEDSDPDRCIGAVYERNNRRG